jgi:hypothetical protein
LADEELLANLEHMEDFRVPNLTATIVATDPDKVEGEIHHSREH